MRMIMERIEAHGTYSMNNLDETIENEGVNRDLKTELGCVLYLWTS